MEGLAYGIEALIAAYIVRIRVWVSSSTRCLVAEVRSRDITCFSMNSVRILSSVAL